MKWIKKIICHYRGHKWEYSDTLKDPDGLCRTIVVHRCKNCNKGHFDMEAWVGSADEDIFDYLDHIEQ